MDSAKVKTEILDRLYGTTGEALLALYAADNAAFASLREIRIRTGLPLMIQNADGDLFIEKNGTVHRKAIGYIPGGQEVSEILSSLCKSSLYAYENSIREGFLTIQGGHRIGLAGRYVNGRGILDVASVNIRISGEVKGCALKVLPHILRSTRDIYSTLIISPPCCGKTTLIRDIARLLSAGCKSPLFEGVCVGVVDERSEIAGCCMGIPSNDLGPRCDVYDACPKSDGIYLMLRAMSPAVIVTDEIGGRRDTEAILAAHGSGVRIVATVHGLDLETFGVGREVRELVDTGVFERYILLSARNGPGTIEKLA